MGPAVPPGFLIAKALPSGAYTAGLPDEPAEPAQGRTGISRQQQSAWSALTPFACLCFYYIFLKCTKQHLCKQLTRTVVNYKKSTPLNVSHTNKQKALR